MKSPLFFPVIEKYIKFLISSFEKWQDIPKVNEKLHFTHISLWNQITANIFTNMNENRPKTKILQVGMLF